MFLLKKEWQQHYISPHSDGVGSNPTAATSCGGKYSAAATPSLAETPFPPTGAVGMLPPESYNRYSLSL